MTPHRIMVGEKERSMTDTPTGDELAPLLAVIRDAEESREGFNHGCHGAWDCPAVIKTARLLVAMVKADADEANHERDGCFADDDAMCAHKSIAAEARAAYERSGEG